jgi:signal transduction histidine kinase/HAMP domain-containing protein
MGAARTGGGVSGRQTAKASTQLASRSSGKRREEARDEGEQALLEDLLAALRAARTGDFSARLSTRRGGLLGEIASELNELVTMNRLMTKELVRVGRIIGREGRMTERASLAGANGDWATSVDSVNALIDDLVRPTTEVARVIGAVAEGDLSQKMALKIEGQPVKGEFLRIGTTVNTMVDQLSSFADEVTRVAREVGTEGKLGGQAKVKGVSGTWKDLTDSVNFMASNLTDQVRNIAQVTTAVAKGDLTQKITVDVKGEILELKNTINTMVDQLSSFADEVTRVAREVGTEGKLGGQAEVKGVSGTWRGLTENVNFMATNLTDQVRNIAQVTTAVAQGDLSQKITVEAKGEVATLADTINTMVDQLRSFAAEVTRVAREVGTEGKLGGQAEVEDVSGTWRDLTENVNLMASNLTDQVRNIAQVATAVAEGDLSQKITVEAKGEVAALTDTINMMVDQLRSFAAEVTRVAREVGTEGKLGGQAEVEDVSGTWRGLTENVNLMATNLTDQVRNIAQVTTAVAKGDLSQKITVDAKGEILELKNTINTMVDQLSSFADEVTRVAREVGTEGKLGGQAEVEGVSGTWRRLTENVNQLAGNLTTQVRSIAEVSTAVTQGDLTRSISVEAQGEVAELKDNINQMIANLRDTTKRNEEQDWLKTNLARISGLMQGQRDLRTVTQLIMSELTPTVSAQHGAFFLAESPDEESKVMLRLIASYGYQQRKNVSNTFELGEGLVGQAAIEHESILITEAPPDYIQVTSGLGAAAPVNIIVMPILFEEQVLGVIELASLKPYSEVHRTFLQQLMETLGVVLNTIMANMRTEELLQQSQSLTQELQTQSEELQRRQEELQSRQEQLKRSNAELEQQAQSLKASEELLQSQQEKLQRANDELQEKAALLEERNSDIETKNGEIEMARLRLEEKAAQLALSSKYKSEFLANMSHELRTPLNSLLILSRLLLENEPGNLDPKQLEFARTIHAAGTDLLQLISDILDLSKIEAGKMEILPDLVSLGDVQAYVARTFDPIAADKGLIFEVDADPALPNTILTDEQRLEQILRNLLSNAFKFTEQGSVTLSIGSLSGDRVSFTVCDTGVGIPPDKLQAIFEAFQQADGTTSRKYGGTGLGLSISRELARALGGEIQVSSTVGKGATFALILPTNYARAAMQSLDLPLPIDAARPTLTHAGLRPARRDQQESGRGSGSPAAATEGAAPVAGAALGEHVSLERPPTSEQSADRATTSDRDGQPAAVPHAGANGLDEERGSRRVLIVERGSAAQEEISVLAGESEGISITSVSTAEQAGLAEPPFTCVVLGEGIPKTAIFAMLERMSSDRRFSETTFILRPDRALTEREHARLSRLLPSSAATVVESSEQLTAEVAMALHQSQQRAGRSLSAGFGGEGSQVNEALRKRTALLVDDDVRNLFALASLLEDSGMAVLFGETGKEALAALDRHHDVDVVLMDIMMPDMDGNETIAAIRQMPRLRELPIIAVTAKAMEGDRERSLAAGASDYITKPVEPERLLALIGTWLRR